VHVRESRVTGTPSTLKHWNIHAHTSSGHRATGANKTPARTHWNDSTK